MKVITIKLMNGEEITFKSKCVFVDIDKLNDNNVFFKVGDVSIRKENIDYILEGEENDE